LARTFLPVKDFATVLPWEKVCSLDAAAGGRVPEKSAKSRRWVLTFPASQSRDCAKKVLDRSKSPRSNKIITRILTATVCLPSECSLVSRIIS